MNQMTDRAVRLLALAATVVVIVGSVAYANASGAGVVAIASMLLVAGSFLITGFVAWAHRPANRMGRLMVALALCLLLTAFAQPVWPVVVPFGLLVFALSNSLLGYLILAYPSGELRSNANRALVALTFVFGGGPRFVRLLTQDPRASGLGFDNPYLVFHDPTFASTMARLPYYLDIVLLVVFVIFVVARWIGASGPARRSLSPAMVPTVALLMVLIGDAITIVIDVPADVRAFFDNAQLLARIAIPIGFLAGLLRMQIARSAIADLVVELGGMPSPARLQVALAHALGDPTLMVVYPTPRPDVFVDAAGANVNVPEEGSGRVVTMLGHDGKTLAALIHDEGLPVDPGLVAGVASALRLAVDNDRLQTQVESQLDEVRASRARIVAAGDAERKRVERDLHDGDPGASPRPGEDRRQWRRGRQAQPRAGVGGGEGGALGVARAGTRDPPPDPDRGRPRRSDRIAGQSIAGRRRGQRRPGSLPVRRRRSRVLRCLRGVGQCRQVRAGEPRPRSGPVGGWCAVDRGVG